MEHLTRSHTGTTPAKLTNRTPIHFWSNPNNTQTKLQLCPPPQPPWLPVGGRQLALNTVAGLVGYVLCLEVDGAVAGWRSSVLLPVGGCRCCFRLSVPKSVVSSAEFLVYIDEGETPTVSKLYLRVHQTKGNQWVDDKSKAAYEKYVQKLSETQVTQSTQATFDVSTPSTPSEPSYDEQIKIWIDANGLTKWGRLCGFGPEGDIYTNSQGPCFIQNCGKAYTNTFATLVDENERQKIELDSQKKVLDDVQVKLTLEQAKSKKQTKKVHKYAKATQDIQA